MSLKDKDVQEVANRRLILVRYGVCGMLCLAVISQARVHLIQRGKIMDRARESKRFIVEKAEPAIRGAIYSADGKALSQADDRRILVIDFRKVPHSSGFFMALGAASGISPSELTSLAGSGKKVVEWNRTFTAAQSEEIQNVKRKWRADGIGTRVSANRAYGLGEAASSLVGVYRSNGATLGVEQAYDETLKGANGKIVGMVDKEGQYLPMRVDRSTKRKTDGKTVTLTIDSELQNAAYEAIKSAVTARNARQGAVVMMDPSNGNVLACASYPSFDPTKPFRETKPGELPDGFATAFQASLEPGSTFKIATVAKAIDEGVLSSGDVVKCVGSFTVGGKTIHCALHGGTRSHGPVNPEQAIARSCNVAAAQYALRVGNEKFDQFLEDVGLLERHPLGLPGEPRPQYQKDAPAPRLHLANVGFGQAINVTPVALATSFCVIANGGIAVKPRLIDRIGEQIQPVQKGKRVLKPETCETVLNYMRSVISSDRGTGKTLRIPGYDLGGKTGTAQKTNRTTKSMQGGGYVANFVGFVPAANPRAVILVMVDDPKGQEYYGAQVAGPVFLEVAKHAIKRLSIPKGVLPTKFARLPSERSNSTVPTLSVKSRPIDIRKEALVIGKQDQPVAQSRPRSEKPKAEDVVIDRNQRRLVSERDGNEKTDPRIKIRKETDEVTRRIESKSAISKSKTPVKKSSEKTTSRTPTKKSTRDELGEVSTSGGSAIVIRNEPRTASKKASTSTKSTTQTKATTAPTKSASTSKRTTAKTTEPVKKTSAVTTKSSAKTSSTSSKPASKSTPTKSSSTKSTTASKSTATKTASTKTSTKTATTSSKKPGISIRKVAETPTKKATSTSATKTTAKPVVSKKAPVKTTRTEDRVKELERENERLRKLLDSKTGTKKSTGKAEVPTRKKSDSKKPSKKPE